MVGVCARLLVFLPLVAFTLGCGSSSKPAAVNDANGRPITSLVHVRVRVRGVWLEFGSNRFTGAYQDQVSWPPSARGKLLIFEATVAQGTRLKTFRFWLRPR